MFPGSYFAKNFFPGTYFNPVDSGGTVTQPHLMGMVCNMGTMMRKC